MNPTINDSSEARNPETRSQKAADPKATGTVKRLARYIDFDQSGADARCHSGFWLLPSGFLNLRRLHSLVTIASVTHPIPSRTRPRNQTAPMVLLLKQWKSRSSPGFEAGAKQHGSRTHSHCCLLARQENRRHPRVRRFFCACGRAAVPRAWCAPGGQTGRRSRESRSKWI